MKKNGDVSQNGATLVYVTIVCAILVLLATLIAGLVRAQGRLTNDLLSRAALRDAAESGLFQAVELLDAETNRVDTLSEQWGRMTADSQERYQAGEDGVFVFIEDESARLHFRKNDKIAFANVLMLTTGQDPAIADSWARIAYDWQEGLSGEADEVSGVMTNRVFSAEEELLESPLGGNEAFAAGLRGITVHGDGKININTVGHDVFVGLAVAQGISRESAEALFRRLELARDQGVFFESTQASEALKLLPVTGSLPSPEERNALLKLQRFLRVDAACFRILVLARDRTREVGLQAIYEPATGRFLRWVSW